MEYGFLNDLLTKDLDTGEDVELIKSLWATTPYGKCQAQKGMISDKASIPKPARIVIPKSGKYNRSAVIHDGLYQNGRRIKTDPRSKISREIADEIYLGLMEYRNVAGWNRKTQWAILRMFGWIVWNKYRKQDKIRYANETV